MKRYAIALVIPLLALAAGPAFGGARPALREVSRQPLVVGGNGFHAGERVRVSVVVLDATRATKTVVARYGSFRVGFDLTLGRCARPTVRAIGSSGSSATLKLTPRMACLTV